MDSATFHPCPNCKKSCKEFIYKQGRNAGKKGFCCDPKYGGCGVPDKNGVIGPRFGVIEDATPVVAAAAAAPTDTQASTILSLVTRLSTQNDELRSSLAALEARVAELEGGYKVGIKRQAL